MSAVPAGARVQIEYEALAAGERAPGVPDDTADLPYVIRAKGVLTEPASLGEQATVATPTGRHLTGVLVDPEPADRHTFGTPVPALVATYEGIDELRRSLS